MKHTQEGSNKRRRTIDWTEQDRQPVSQDLRDTAQEDSEDEDEIVLRSRWRQQRLRTPGRSEAGEVEPPAKKKRRILPWTDEGRLLWPVKKRTAVELESDSEEEASEGGGHDVALVKDSQCGGECDSASLEESDEDRCSSFVVDDDSESVVEEESASERYLAIGALQEVRVSIVERMEKLKRRLESVEGQLKRLADVDGKNPWCDGEDSAVRKADDGCDWW
jgi:hypothetical protein